MATPRHVMGDDAFPRELSNAGANKLVVVDFTASWCGPCKRIAPFFAELASKYSHVLFLKVDVDECPRTANDNKVQAMPTFMFFRNSEKLDSIRGADPEALEKKVRELGGDKPKLEAFSGVGQTLGGGGGGLPQPPPWDRPSASTTHPAPSQATASSGVSSNGDVAGAAAAEGIHLVPMLMEMGFSKQKCVRAVTITKTTEIQVALEWLFEHADDPDDLVVTDDDVVMADVIASSKSETNANVEVVEKSSTLGPDEPSNEAAVGASAALVDDSKEDGEVDETSEEAPAASLKCDDCGKLFKGPEYAEMHAMKTQHINFSESTEKIKPLTEEEKAAKLKEIEEKMKERRSAREAKEKEEAILREKMRRKQGKEIVAAKAEHDEIEMKKLAEQRRLEKLEEKAAKQRVLDQIARDRAERAVKFAKKTDPVPPPAAAPAPPADIGPKKSYDECKLQIRLPDGTTLTHQFGAKEELSAVRLYVDMNRKDGLRAQPFTFMTNFPRKVFSASDMSKPLSELGLVPSAVLIVTKPS